MKRAIPTLILIALFTISGAVVGCGDDQEAAADTEGTFEEIGEGVDETKQAAEETAKSAEETIEKVEDAAEDDGGGHE